MKVYPLHIYFNKYFCNDPLFSLHLEFLCINSLWYIQFIRYT